MASLSWPCKIKHMVRYTELSPARFKDFWIYIASVVGRVKISILLWRYGRIAGELVNDDILLLEVMRTGVMHRCSVGRSTEGDQNA